MIQRHRVAALGIFGASNLGNEATLAAFRAALDSRLPQAEVSCIVPHGSAVATQHGVEPIPMEPLRVRHRFWPYYGLPLTRHLSALAQVATEPWRRRRAAAFLAGFDALVIPGTGILDDFGQTAFDLPHHLDRWTSAAVRARVPVSFLSVGAEPVEGALQRRFLRRAAERAAYRSYRDDESRNNALRLGLRAGDDPVLPDLAFGLPEALLPAAREVAWPPRTVGFGIMGYYGWNRTAAAGERIYRAYIEKAGRFVTWLLRHGYEVHLLIGDTRADERPLRELLDGVERKEGAGGRLVADPMPGFPELLGQIVMTDIVVGTRYHNVLLSLLLERPTVSLGYSRKNDGLVQGTGLEPYCQDVATFDVDRLIADFERIAKAPEPPIELIRHRNTIFRRELDQQYDLLVDRLIRAAP
jgi:polysaccharide pyruvyl transferase WcaK-like protein